MPGMFRLETDRLLIRPWRDDDRPRFAEIMSDAEVTRFVHRGEPYTSADIDEFLARQARQLAEYGVCMGPVEEKSTGRVVGLSGTQPLGTTGHFEIGWIFGPDVWGRGYATEAGAAAMSHVLETLEHPRVVAIIDPGNEGSVRVAMRLGMQYDARYTGAQLGHRSPEIVVDLYYRTR
jgi:ribosomal-protein-alanine N-acetyltransferase